jgi:hypothetical protein
MTDTQVLSASSDPPLHQVSSALLDQWQAWKTALLAATCFLKLFTSNVIVTAATTLADLLEASAPGYTPFPVTVLNGPALDADGNAYMVTNAAYFACTGGGDDVVYGAYLVEALGAAATATFTGAGGGYSLPVITSGGSLYQVAPRVKATGAGGTGAVLTATITSGVVTGITIVEPGTGYTTFTATIEPPESLVAAGNFVSPLPLQQNTDAIPVVVELDRLAT